MSHLVRYDALLTGFRLAGHRIDRWRRNTLVRGCSLKRTISTEHSLREESLLRARFYFSINSECCLPILGRSETLLTLLVAAKRTVDGVKMVPFRVVNLCAMCNSLPFDAQFICFSFFQVKMRTDKQSDIINCTVEYESDSV